MEEKNIPTTSEPDQIEGALELHKLLAHIAAEIHFLAEQNDQVQDTLLSLMQPLRLESSDMQSIQALDLLSQKKRDLGSLLERVAMMISETESIPHSKIADSLKLEYLKFVLINGSKPKNKKSDLDNGKVNFF